MLWQCLVPGRSWWSGCLWCSGCAHRCGYNQTGNLVQPWQSVDGLMGLGRGGVSLMMQMSRMGLGSEMFAVCLGGEVHGGGSLILGPVTSSGFSYTRLYTPKSVLPFDARSAHGLLCQLLMPLSAAHFRQLGLTPCSALIHCLWTGVQHPLCGLARRHLRSRRPAAGN